MKKLARARFDQYVLVELATGNLPYQDFIHAAGTKGPFEGEDATLERCERAWCEGFQIGLWIMLEDGPSTYNGQRKAFGKAMGSPLEALL